MTVNANVTQQQITANVSGDDISVSVSGGIGPSGPTGPAGAGGSGALTAADITSGTIDAARLPLATTTEAQNGASTSVVATPGRLNEWLRSRCILTTSAFQSSTSGQVVVQNANAGITQLHVGSASGVGTLSIYSVPGFSPTLPKWNGSVGNYSGRHVNWTRPVRLSARFAFGNSLPTANATFRVLLGKAVVPTAANVAALAHRGVGFEIRRRQLRSLDEVVVNIPGGEVADNALWLTTHNGTARTDTQATSVTFATNSAYEVVAESDGTGTANLYLDGTLVATSSGAPTTGANDGNQQYINIEATCTDSAESMVIFNRQIIVTQI